MTTPESTNREGPILFDGLRVSVKRSGGIAQMSQLIEAGDEFVQSRTSYGNNPAETSEKPFDENSKESLRGLIQRFQASYEGRKIAQNYGNSPYISDPMETQINVGKMQVIIHTD